MPSDHAAKIRYENEMTPPRRMPGRKKSFRQSSGYG